MPDDMFKRFRAGAQAAKPSGGASKTGAAIRLREAELLAAVDRVPALPAVVTKILQAVSDEHSSAGDLENTVASDMVISGRLLKLVNSPFYGLRNPVSSLTQAMAIIGFGSLRSLVLAAGATDVLNRSLVAYGFEEGGLATSALVTAGLAREVALVSGVTGEGADDYFVAALLRDVGMLVLGPLLEEHGQILRKTEIQADIIARERAACGFDHCWAGERVADKWSLPPGVAMVVSSHHRIPADAEPAHMKLLAGVRLAERLVFRKCIGMVEDHPFVTDIDAVLLEAAGIDGAGLKRLIERMADCEDMATRILSN